MRRLAVLLIIFAATLLQGCAVGIHTYGWFRWRIPTGDRLEVRRIYDGWNLEIETADKVYSHIPEMIDYTCREGIFLVVPGSRLPLQLKGIWISIDGGPFHQIHPQQRRGRHPYIFTVGNRQDGALHRVDVLQEYQDPPDVKDYYDDPGKYKEGFSFKVYNCKSASDCPGLKGCR